MHGARGVYHPTHELTRGGTARVYRAERDDGTIWAVKVFDVYRQGAQVYMGDAQARAEFTRDGAILARLDHPCIPRYEEAFTLPDGRPVLVMEHIAAKNLACILSHGALTEAQARAYTIQICSILAYLHSQGISMSDGAAVRVLGDVPRGNILVTAAGQIALCDFGAATIGDAAAQRCDLEHVAGLLLLMVADDLWAVPHMAARVAPLSPAVHAVVERALNGGFTSAAELGAALASPRSREALS